MQCRYSSFLGVVCLLGSFLAWGQSIERAPVEDPPNQNTLAPNTPAQNTPEQPNQAQNGGDFSTNTHPGPEGIVPKDTIIVKGAWSSASDSTTPVPEAATLTNNVFTNQYFGITYPVPLGWIQKFTPPPPSESGSYVLAQLAGRNSYRFGQSDSPGTIRGSIMFTAQDMFFTPLPAANARQFVNYSSSHLPEYYKVELKPTQTTIGDQPFTFFAYGSPEAELHWYVLATQIRCHTVEIILMNHDPKALEELVRNMNAKIKFSLDSAAGAGGSVPVCIKNYATGANVIERVDPVLTQQRYNAIPVRIIIDKEGKIKHIHFLSAYPEQQKEISDALKQWKFRPYERNGQRLEVETGIMFGRAPARAVPSTDATTD